MTRPRVACLVGPTASGKTTLALAAAERLGAEIVSADSRQVYRGLDIGTAKPTPIERARVPHHCLDLVEPGESFDAARFRTAAAAAIADVLARGRRVLVVGGTGLYLRALLEGLCPAPVADPSIRAALAALPDAALHARLAVVDAAAAARIHPHDRVRVIRALEVAAATGRPLSALQAGHAFRERPYDALVIGLVVPGPLLDERITIRARRMLDDGLLDEVRALRARCAPDAAVWRTVGYREMRACLEGTIDLATALAATIRATRQLAKRQRTWFRRDPAVRWYDPCVDAEHILAALRTHFD